MSEEQKNNLTEEKAEAIQTENKVDTAAKAPKQKKVKQKQPKKNKKSKKEDEALKGLSMKERKKVLDERKEKRRKKWYIALGIVIVVLIAGLLFFDSGILQRNMTAITVGEKNYSVAELDYYYYNSYNSYSSYASYYGLDTSKSLKDQEIYSGTSWYDYFRDNAKNTLTNVAVLLQEAEKANYKLSDEGQKTVDDTLQQLKDTCAEKGYTVSAYLSSSYGRYMNYATFEKVMTDSQLAQEYEKKMKKSFDQSDDDVNQYYDEHKAELDTFEYTAYLVPVSTDTGTDEDGNAVEATDEETAAAEAKAKKVAAALKKAMTEGNQDKIADVVEKYGATDYSNQTYENFSSYSFSDWLTNEKRETGDVTSMKYESKDSNEETTLNGYYVVQFEKRYLDKYHNANYRNILISAEAKTDENDQAVTDDEGNAVYDYDAAKKTAEELQKKWQDNGGDEDAFTDLVADNSGDDTSSGNSGLYEGAAKTDVSDTVSKWLFSEKRKAGDYTILKDENNTGYQLIYFVSYSEKYHWQDASISALQDAAYSDWYDGAAKNYKESTTLMYRFV